MSIFLLTESRQAIRTSKFDPRAPVVPFEYVRFQTAPSPANIHYKEARRGIDSWNSGRCVCNFGNGGDKWLSLRRARAGARGRRVQLISERALGKHGFAVGQIYVFN